MEIRSHRDLIVWQRAMELAMEVHQLAKRLPASERPWLAMQMWRAAISVAANIAEGAGRFHRGDYLRFISIARGSLMEVDTHMELAVALGYLPREEIQRAEGLSAEVLKMLTKLGRVLVRPSQQSTVNSQQEASSE